MSKIFISGGGDENDSFLLDKEFANNLDKNGQILYLPIALSGEELSYESCEKWINSTFKKFNTSKIKMITEKPILKNIIVDNYEAVYIGGGNTFLLLEKLRELQLENKLRKFFKNNGIIYGGSAGAIILGKDIMTSSHMDENANSILDTRGLNLLNGFSVWCHYDISDMDRIHNYISLYNVPVIALTEKTGLCIENNKAKVIGKEDALIFTKNKVDCHSPNEEFQLTNAST